MYSHTDMSPGGNASFTDNIIAQDAIGVEHRLCLLSSL